MEIPKVIHLEPTVLQATATVYPCYLKVGQHKFPTKTYPAKIDSFSSFEEVLTQ